MNNFKRLMKRQDGFTLVEMLIVVAIIAILVAVSIPAVTRNMAKAQHAADMANERAAKAAGMLKYLDTDTAFTDKYYDAVKGTIEDSGTATYGKHNGHDYLQVTVDANGVASVKWKTNTTTGTYANCGESNVDHNAAP